MCGIVGYVGEKQAQDVVIEGLRRLEYRGYDSAGVALVADHAHRLGEEGRQARQPREGSSRRPRCPRSTTGIGHTRWATHGAPNDTNAHPHLGNHGRVALVHNGIIENFAELRAEVEAAGDELRSETDTEIAAHLVETALAGGGHAHRGDAAGLLAARGCLHAGRGRRRGPVARRGRTT